MALVTIKASPSADERKKREKAYLDSPRCRLDPATQLLDLDGNEL
jgi:hypothetical protein